MTIDGDLFILRIIQIAMLFKLMKDGIAMFKARKNTDTNKEGTYNKTDYVMWIIYVALFIFLSLNIQN